MTLPDFSEHEGFNELRQQMGAELIKWIDIDSRLVTEGIEIPPEVIEEYHCDGPLEYKERKVVVHIQDRVNPANLPKFHVANCRTLEDMRKANEYGRYVVATRTDGRFIVNLLVGGETQKVERRLYVCRNCLMQLNYKGYWRAASERRDKIVECFDLETFFNQYPPNWTEISYQTREKAGWKCKVCCIDLTSNKKFLHTHHKNGRKNDNSESNLIALCIDCHAKQRDHEHLRLLQRYAEFQRWQQLRHQ